MKSYFISHVKQFCGDPGLTGQLVAGNIAFVVLFDAFGQQLTTGLQYCLTNLRVLSSINLRHGNFVPPALSPAWMMIFFAAPAGTTLQLSGPDRKRSLHLELHHKCTCNRAVIEP